MEMQGRIDEGIAWLTWRMSRWATPDNVFAPHNWWHPALFHIDRRIDGPQADMMLVLVDCTALLWRLRVEGVDVGDRFERAARQTDRCQRDACGGLAATAAGVAPGGRPPPALGRRPRSC